MLLRTNYRADLYSIVDARLPWRGDQTTTVFWIGGGAVEVLERPKAKEAAHQRQIITFHLCVQSVSACNFVAREDETHNDGCGENERETDGFGIQLEGISNAELMLYLSRFLGFFELVDNAGVDQAHLADSCIVQPKNAIVRSFDLDDGRASAFISTHDLN